MLVRKLLQISAIAALIALTSGGNAAAMDTVAKQAIVADYQTGTILI